MGLRNVWRHFCACWQEWIQISSKPRSNLLFLVRVCHSCFFVSSSCFFVSCQVPHRGHAQRGRHGLQATVLDRSSRVLVPAGLARVVLSLSGTMLRTVLPTTGGDVCSGLSLCAPFGPWFAFARRVASWTWTRTFSSSCPSNWSTTRPGEAKGVAVLVHFVLAIVCELWSLFAFVTLNSDVACGVMLLGGHETSIFRRSRFSQCVLPGRFVVQNFKDDHTRVCPQLARRWHV